MHHRVRPVSMGFCTTNKGRRGWGSLLPPEAETRAKAGTIISFWPPRARERWLWQVRDYKLVLINRKIQMKRASKRLLTRFSYQLNVIVKLFIRRHFPTVRFERTSVEGEQGSERWQGEKNNNRRDEEFARTRIEISGDRRPPFYSAASPCPRLIHIAFSAQLRRRLSSASFSSLRPRDLSRTEDKRK